ncbi:MAG TPA: septum site-determining protein Ssd [Candidatus Limnocylindria bacterium]|nr:septum site-determining protein Ssd [Candidatus Limnocylindria bacterium]
MPRLEARDLWEGSMATDDPTILGSTRRVLVATGSADLLDDLLRLSSAAGVEVEVAPDAAGARRSWVSAAGVLVGDDLAPALLLRPPARRDGVVLVGVDQDDAGVWRRGVDLGAGHVVFLPDAEPWVVGWLADRVDVLPGLLGTGLVVGVVGGRGGAGASTLTVALGLAAVRREAEALVVDMDPLGGGLDLMLGLEHAPGLRWPDLAASRGRVSATSLRSAVMTVDGLGVLPWSRDDLFALPPEAVAAVLSAAARAYDLVVVDLPRTLDADAEEAAARCSVTYLVVPAEVRAVSAAARVAAVLGGVTPSLEVVVRGPSPSGLGVEEVADALGLSLGGAMRAEPRLSATLDRGELPGSGARSPLARLSNSLVGGLLSRTETGRAA